MTAPWLPLSRLGYSRNVPSKSHVQAFLDGVRTITVFGYRPPRRRRRKYIAVRDPLRRDLYVVGHDWKLFVANLDEKKAQGYIAREQSRIPGQQRLDLHEAKG